jgi:hypothetical protein
MSIWAVLARFGFFRIIRRKMLPAPYQEKMPDYPFEIMFTPRYFAGSRIEDAVASDNEVRETNGFGDTPLIVIVHSIPDPLLFGRLQGEDLEEGERLFQEAAMKLAALSTNSEYVVAEGSGHLITIERPDVVIDAILSLVKYP